MSVVVIGDSSFLGKSLKESGPSGDWRFLSHKKAIEDTSWIEQADCLINFSFPPSFKTAGYDPSQDIDGKLARLIEDKAVHYIMISTRMVYGEPGSDFCLSENLEPNPANTYGRSKLAVEKNLASILPPENLTILRLGNIFGHELGRDTFMGRAETGLREQGRITFDISPQAVRDFLAVWHFSKAIRTIALRPKPGLFNLGSGYPTSCGQVAQWLIDGFGSGEMVLKGNSLQGQFWLDMSKTRKAFDLEEVTSVQLRDDCIACGLKLKTRAS